MKSRILAILTAITLAPATVLAVPISGSISMFGDFNSVDGNWNSVGLDQATGLDFLGDDFTVDNATGDFGRRYQQAGCRRNQRLPVQSGTSPCAGESAVVDRGFRIHTAVRHCRFAIDISFEALRLRLPGRTRIPADPRVVDSARDRRDRSVLLRLQHVVGS